MSDRAKKWLIGAAGLMTAIVFWRMEAPIWLLFLTVAIFFVVAMNLSWFLSTNTRTWGLGSRALAYTVLIAIILWPVPERTVVSINCLPLTIPLRGEQEGSLYAMSLDPKSGTQLVSTPSMSWPLWAMSKELAYKCEVVNSGRFALHGLSVVFLATFRAGSDLPPKKEIMITYPVSLEAHSSAMLHIADDTKQVLEVMLPQSVSAQVGDEKRPRKIPVRYPTSDGRPVKLRGFNP
jgi:hypothetical protein